MSSNAVDKFTELEAKIVRTIEMVKTTRQEKLSLERELATASKQVDRLEREIEELRRERDLIRHKVESMLESLSVLTEETLV